MTLKEIVEAVQHITRENIIIDSSILEKAADQLSLTEVNAFVERTKISLDFLATGKAKTSRDRQITDYLKAKEVKERWDALRQEIIDYIISHYPGHIDNFDFITRDGLIDGYELLMRDDYDLYTLISQKYPLSPTSDEWHGEISDWNKFEEKIHEYVGRQLNDYRFAAFCISTPSIATDVLNRLDKSGFDSTIDNLKSIILLIENGGTLLPNVGVSGDATAHVGTSYFLTTLLKDYCYRKISELQ